MNSRPGQRAPSTTACGSPLPFWPSLERRTATFNLEVLLRVLFCALALSLFAGAAAQTGFVGASLGITFVGPLPTPPANVHLGFSVTPRIDLRADLTYYVTGRILQLSPNVLTDLGSGDSWYAGGGPRMVRVGGISTFGLGVLGGREFPMANDLTWFLEGGLDLLVTVIPLSLVKFAVGVNYHF